MINETDPAVLALNRLENELRRHKYRLQIALGHALRQDDDMREFNVVAAEIRGVDFGINAIMDARRKLQEE